MKPILLTADSKGKIFDIPALTATGAKSGVIQPLKSSDLIKLPYGSELFVLPDRLAVGYDESNEQFISTNQLNLSEGSKKTGFAVAAFISPGYTLTKSTSFIQAKPNLTPLPLFSYAPVALYKNIFYVPAIRVDSERRQDLRLMPKEKIQQNVIEFEKIFKKNRLFHQLKKCALIYNCPAGKNFFLNRYEGPLPTSQTCNARCLGCISLQQNSCCPATQPRIEFTPTPDEIAEIALFHIKKTKNPVVSFGQGCEGEPLMVWKTICKAIEIIRKSTVKGTINLNTNASKPDIISKLIDTGLNSIRVSLNSARKDKYHLYYRPLTYNFNDVTSSIRTAKKLGTFVSINYLTMPGFTDNTKEVSALLKLIERTNIDMIQWRNLNYDPIEYCKVMQSEQDPKKMIGIKNLMELIKMRFPNIKFGYFNPPKEKWGLA
ncbi:MAG: radical SAM protein [Candidatus Omnitrophota bacterium]